MASPKPIPTADLATPTLVMHEGRRFCSKNAPLTVPTALGSRVDSWGANKGWHNAPTRVPRPPRNCAKCQRNCAIFGTLAHISTFLTFDLKIH